MKKLYAGVSRVDITTLESKVNDPLYAKALVLKTNEKTIALVSLDYVSLGGGISEISDSFFGELRTRVLNQGLDCLVCGVTHTHTNFPMSLPEEEVKERVVMAISQAMASLEPVTVGSSMGKNDDFLNNRTLKLSDGTYWSIGQAHPCPPDSRMDESPFADDTVGVLRFDKENGQPLCVMFTFGCHPLVGYANNLPTANYPGVAEQFVEKNTGAVAMMFQSCGGDVSEIDYKNYDHPKSCYNHGISLGNTVVDVVNTIKTEDVDVSFCRKEITLPLRDDFEQARQKYLDRREELLKSMRYCPLNFKAFLPLYMKYLVSPEYPLGYKYEYQREERLGIEQLKNQDVINRNNIRKYLSNLEAMEELSRIACILRVFEVHENRNKSLGVDKMDTEVVGVRIGDTMLITAPVEPLSELGPVLKSMSPLEKTFVVGYANGFMHYGALPQTYNNGGYETIECMLSKDWFEVYQKAVTEIFENLK